MKKLFSTTLLFVIFFNVCVFAASARTVDESPAIIVNTNESISYDNGNGTTTTVYPVREIISDVPQTRGTIKTTIGAVDAINTDNGTGDENWRYTLIGYFTYEEGVSCVCTNATHEVTISDDWWHFSDGANTWSGNAAYGTGTFKYNVLFITTKTLYIDLRICCDSYGNFY